MQPVSSHIFLVRISWKASLVEVDHPFTNPLHQVLSPLIREKVIISISLGNCQCFINDLAFVNPYRTLTLPFIPQNPMLIFLLSFFLSFLFLFFNSTALRPVSWWASKTRILSLFIYSKALQFSSRCLRSISSFSLLTTVSAIHSTMSTKSEVVRRENVEVVEGIPFLDLPELVLESILTRLSPAGLCNMAAVCSSLRERCRSDHLWEKHMEEKWGRVIGKTAVSELQSYLASETESLNHDRSSNGWIRSLSAIWPLSWMKFNLDGSCKTSRNYVLSDSVMSRYLALESGKFWFSAQVYNRENGHVGFLLSSYDAELNYNWHTNTFCARYPPHGRRTMVTEDGVPWERIRAPPFDTPAYELHVSDCLEDLHPGDHIEIQWRRNKEFPYGWWYGMIGHLDFCDASELHCCCHKSDTVVLEFKQYGPNSRWRRSMISRNDHREEGNETDGFYGGIRKLRISEEISRWKQLFPAETLE